MNVTGCSPLYTVNSATQSCFLSPRVAPGTIKTRLNKIEPAQSMVQYYWFTHNTHSKFIYVRLNKIEQAWAEVKDVFNYAKGR